MNKAIQTLIDQNRWQPIENAPKDGLQIVQTNILGDMESDFCYYEEEFDSWWDWTGDYADFQPIHYRPLPDDRCANALEIAVKALRYYMEIDSAFDMPDEERKALNALKQIAEIAEEKWEK